MNIRQKLAAPCLLPFLLAAAFVGPAHAGSTVNPNVPAPGAPLASAPIRDNFLATSTDINNILGMFAGASPPTSPSVGQDWLNIGTSPYVWSKWTGAGGWGQVGTINPSTGAVAFALSSGSVIGADPITVSFTLGAATIGLATDANFAVVSHQLALAPIASGSLLANCTGSMAEPTAQTMTACLDQNLGTTPGLFAKRGASTWSGFNLFGTSNIFTALQVVNMSAVAPPAAISGAALQVVGADATVGRIEVDSFGAIGAVTLRRANGTGASPTALTTSDQIGAFNFHGYYVTGGPAYSGVQASVAGFAAQPWTSTALGTYVEIRTTPNGTTTLTGVARFENDGGVTLPSTVTGGSKGPGTLNAGGLYVNGVAVTGAGITALTGDATASGPGSAAITVLHAPASGITGTTLNATVVGSSLTGVGALASGSLATGFTPITNALLANSSTTVNGQNCALGGTCTISAAASLVVGSTSISGGSANGILAGNGAGTALAQVTTANGGLLNTSNAGVPSITPTPVLGVAGSVVGSIGFQNATSGTVTLAPAAGALGTVTATLPANSGVIAELNLAQSWTALQTFNNSSIAMLGSSTGFTTLTSDNAGASNFTLHLPAANDTVALLGKAGQVVAGGALVTTLANAAGSLAVDCSARPLQTIPNTGAFSITAPAADSSCLLQVVNMTGAATPTYVDFSKLTPKGDTFSTADTSNSTVTVTSASPGVVSWSAHGLVAESIVFFTNSGGALPTGLTASTQYYVCKGATLLTNSFAVATSRANALAGTCVNTSSTGTGTQTAHQASVFLLSVPEVNGLATGIWTQQQ